MKINFTKAEYRTLIELLYLGEWMLTSHDASPSPETARHRQLCQKVYAYCKKMGCEDLFENDDGETFPTRAFEDRMFGPIDAYNDENFWHDIIARLGERDALAEVGQARLSAMDGRERVRLFAEKEEPWYEEVRDHGVSRFGVVESDE